MKIKEIHDGLLKILIEFDSLCRRNDIHYSLHAGTLIGAIREHGFIAWDDDADVAMTRTEYQKLEKVVTKDPDLYLRRSIKCQVCSKANPNLWVDIFILDYISEKKVQQKLKLGLLTAIDIMSRDKNSLKLSKLENYTWVKKTIYRIIYLIGKIFPTSAKQKWYQDVSQRRLLGNHTVMLRSNDRFGARELLVPVEWTKDYTDVLFEGHSLMMTVSYDPYLRLGYGDYMTPVKEKGQEKTHDLVRRNSIY